MDANLAPMYERVMNATRPEDMFSDLHLVLPQRLLVAHLSPEVAEFREMFDPGQYSDVEDQDAAVVALERFETLYAQGLEKAAKGLYALDGFSPVPETAQGRTIAVDGITYRIGQKFSVGEHSSLYEASFSIDGGTAKAVIRLANAVADNPFLNNEIRILDRLRRKVADKELGYWRYLPYILGKFNAGDRVGIVYRWFEGVTATEIRMNRLHKNGLDQRHMIWIFDRMINLLGYAHNRGVIHGRIEPDRLRIRSSNHNVMLTGWSQAVYKPATTGEIISGGVNNPFLAPEIADTGEAGPWTDIYSLGKSMIWLLGGDPITNEIPDTVHDKITRFLLHLVRENPRARPKDAWQLYKAQNRLKDSLWERRFIHLNLV